MGGTPFKSRAMFCAAALLLASVGTLHASSPFACQFRPTSREVSKVESRLTLPKDSTKLQTYTREYVGISIGCERKVFGYLVRPDGGMTGWVRRHRSTETIGFLTDLQHCQAVFVLYNLTTGTLERSACDFVKESIPGVPQCPL